MTFNQHVLPPAVQQQAAGRTTGRSVRHPVKFAHEPTSPARNTSGATDALERLHARIASERSRLDGFDDLRSEAVRAYEARLDWITERETLSRSRLDDLLPLLPAAEAEAEAEDARKCAEATEALLHVLTEADRDEAGRQASIARLKAEQSKERARLSVLEAKAAELNEVLAESPDDEEAEEP